MSTRIVCDVCERSAPAFVPDDWEGRYVSYEPHPFGFGKRIYGEWFSHGALGTSMSKQIEHRCPACAHEEAKNERLLSAIERLIDALKRSSNEEVDP